MSGELIRYNQDQRGLIKVSEARRKMDEALAILRGEASLVIEAIREPSYEVLAPRQTNIGAGTVLDLPRNCVVHNRAYVSRYVRAADGFFHYGQSIRITTKSNDQYGADMQEPGSVKSSELEEETCPWCFAAGFGSILCNKCHTEVCYGKTISNTFFHCRDGCPGSGRLVTEARSNRGLRPQLRSGSSPFAGC